MNLFNKCYEWKMNRASELVLCNKYGYIEYSRHGRRHRLYFPYTSPGASRNVKISLFKNGQFEELFPQQAGIPYFCSPGMLDSDYAIVSKNGNIRRIEKDEIISTYISEKKFD
jgi:hypothetical protein